MASVTWPVVQDAWTTRTGQIDALLGGRVVLAVTDVRDYGAVGDGVHDDRPAIQAAIDAAAATAGMAVVYVPPGQYLITSTLLFYQVSNVGMGGPGEIVTAMNDRMVTVLESSSIVFDGLRLRGKDGPAPRPAYTSNLGISVQQSSNIEVRNCHIRECGGAAILTTCRSGSSNNYDPTNSHTYMICGNRISDCGMGVVLFQGSRKALVTDNLITDTCSTGIMLDDGTSGEIEYNVVSDAIINDNVLIRCNYGVAYSAGITLAASHGVICSNNLIVDAGLAPVTGDMVISYGIIVASGGTQSNGVAIDNVVSGNLILRPSRIGMLLAGATYSQVYGNQIVDPGLVGVGGTRYGIYIISQTLADSSVQGSDYNVVRNNLIRATTAADDGTGFIYQALAVGADCNNNIITDNLFRNVDQSPPYVDAGTGTIILRCVDDTTPVTNAPTYAASNVTTERTFNADATTLDELADVVGSLITDLRAQGTLQ